MPIGVKMRQSNDILVWLHTHMNANILAIHFGDYDGFEEKIRKM